MWIDVDDKMNKVGYGKWVKTKMTRSVKMKMKIVRWLCGCVVVIVRGEEFSWTLGG